MLGFIVRRILSSFVVLAVASFLLYMTVTSFGDPLAELRNRNPPVPTEIIEARRAELNLDRSPLERYGIWVGGVVQGDFGENLAGEEIGPVLFRRLQVTMRMVLLSTLLAVGLAVAVGVYSAVRQYTAGDHAATFVGFLFLSTPVFWLAALLKELLAVRLNRALGGTYVYTVGAQSPNLTGSLWERLLDYAGHLALPTLSLALISFAAWSRFQRAAMLDVLDSDYLRLARAKGLSNMRVLLKHGLRNALIPLTTVVAIDFAAVLGGAIVIESVFAWQGMGRLLLDAVNRYDPNVVAAWLLVSGAVVILFNLLADILYGVLDPRIRYG